MALPTFKSAGDASTVDWPTGPMVRFVPPPDCIVERIDDMAMAVLVMVMAVTTDGERWQAPFYGPIQQHWTEF